MLEHNNRQIAKNHAEYITSKELRKYMANKVKQYTPNAKSAFDGAVGSGQMCEFLGFDDILGVEIQQKACEVFMQNFPKAKVLNKSFFSLGADEVEVKDITIMNPPFSLKFNDLSDDEKFNVGFNYPWKKSGVLDDIFILRSLDFCKRFAFHIAYPGICYRKSEKALRELIGTKLAELNTIENGFDDTTIPVVVLVIDKEKTEPCYKSELVDIKTGKTLASDKFEICGGDTWQTARKEEEKEVTNIDEVNTKLTEVVNFKLKGHLETSLFGFEICGKPSKDEILNQVKLFKNTINSFEVRLKEIWS